MKLNLDCLDEVRDEASWRITMYQQKMTRYYNQREKLKIFSTRDLVLRKVTLTTKDLA